MKLLVSTKRGINRRRRGGHEFTQEATVVEVSDANAKLIIADDALNATIVADDYVPGVAPTLDAAAVVKLAEESKAKDAEIDSLKAKLAELEAKLAAGAASTGERERTSSSSSSRK